MVGYNSAIIATKPSSERDTREVLSQRSQYLAAYVGDFPANDGLDTRIAFDWARERAGELACDITVVTPTRRHYRQNPFLGALHQNIDRQTAKTFDTSAQPVMVACWPDESTLDKIDSLERLEALCVVPLVEEEIASWRSARAAIDLLETEAERPVAQISDPVVRAALESLTQRVNLGSGSSHPKDRDAAIQMFRLLHRATSRIDPDEIITWAIANGWPPRDAAALARIGTGVVAGHRYHTRDAEWTDEIINKWLAARARKRD
jgi:hypothetical protein